MGKLNLDIENLSVEERLAALDELWESLRDVPSALQLNKHQEDELDRRIDAVEAGASMGENWEIVRGRLLSRGR